MTEAMKNVDHFWLCMDDPTNLMVITGFMEFKQVLDYDVLCQLFEERLLCFRRFKQYVKRPVTGVGTAYWEEDPNFDIRNHIHRMALPEPGDQKALQQVVSDLSVIPLDPNRPLWQGHLIENYQGGCVLFFRIHHCIADGIALIFVLLSMAGTTPQDSIGPKTSGNHSCQAPPMKDGLIHRLKSSLSNIGKTSEIVKRQVGETVSNPFHLIEMARTLTGVTTDTLSVIAKLAMMPNHPSNCFKGQLGIRKHVAWTQPMPLRSIKTVGQAVEATINDVLIATVTGALRDYLIARNQPVNDVELRVAVPVNIRKPGTEFQLGNYFSLVFLSLPIFIEDPVLRLREVKRRMDDLKHSPDAFVGFQVLNALGMSPAGIAKRAAQFFGNKATAVLTNVPGPRQALFFAGKEIHNMMFWVPRTGKVSLGISIISYNGNVTVGLVSDARLIPDPETILSGFEEEFDFQLRLVNTGEVFKEPLVINDRHREAQIAANAMKQVKKLESTVAVSSVKEQSHCQAITKKGTPCKNSPMKNSVYCNVHQPAMDTETEPNNENG